MRILILLCCFSTVLLRPCSAQTPFTVPPGGLSVLPDGFTRAQNAPFTQTVVPDASSFAYQNLKQANNTPFIAFNQAFASILGSSPSIRVLAQRDYHFAHEGARYYQPTNELLFISDQLKDNNNVPYSTLNAIDIDSGSVRQIPSCPELTTPSGGTIYNGNYLVLQEGRQQSNGTLPAGLLQVDPYSGACQWVTDNFLGLQFNSPRGPTATADGVYFFCDNSLGYQSEQLKGPPQLGNFVWRFDPSEGGPPRVVADGFVTPIGTAISIDQKTLYVTDDGASTPTMDVQGARTIYAYDITGPKSTFLQNRYVFAYTDVGAPGGARIDNFGNVFAGAGDGVNVWDAQGALVGKILFEGGVNSITLAGPLQNIVIVTQNTKIYRVDFSGVTTAANSQISQNG